MSHNDRSDEISVTRRNALKTVAAIAVSPLVAQSVAGKSEPPAATGGAANGQIADTRDQLFDTGWRFHRGHAENAERPAFDDDAWRRLDLPHDWSIEDLPPRSGSMAEAAIWGHVLPRVGPFDSEMSEGQTATGFVMGGVGWYRKHFSVSHLPARRHFEIRFDGVYMDSAVWLNGQHLGDHPYGYTSFAFDLTPHIRREDDNVLAVRVRNLGQNSRWYSGSGIYRHVWLTMTGDVRVPLWGIYVTAPKVSTGSAAVRVATQLENRGNAARQATVRCRLTAPESSQVAVQESPGTVGANSNAAVQHVFALESPLLWSPASPYLYHVEAEVIVNGNTVDRCGTAFGIRTIEVDAERGLRLNGEPIKLKGGCLHHDNGVLGAVAIDRAEERRVELMKANGFNAIRTSHNPPSPPFLDACDRLGMMVIDEAFDIWERGKNSYDYHRFFKEWWQRDLASMVLRDRNHPSVILWSIGNEIPEETEFRGAELAAELVPVVKRLDPTRPITGAIGEDIDPKMDPLLAILDVSGYNYKWERYEKDHQHVPQRVMVGTESFPRKAIESWQATENCPWVIGDFVWTGMDYLGETGIGHSLLEGDPENFLSVYPWFNSYCGDIDLIGGKKPQSYFRDVLWGRSQLEMAVQRPTPNGRKEKISEWGWSDELRSWTWPGFEGKNLLVRVYSSGNQVRLLLNGKEVGTQAVSLASKLRAEFSVPYAPGELRATTVRNGKEIASLSFHTAGKPAKLRLTPDRRTIRADRNDLSYVMVEVLDSAGDLVPDAILPVTFSFEGVGRLAGVGNANPKDVDGFQQPHRRTFQGKCLAVVRPTGARGSVTLRAQSNRLSAAAVKIEVG